MLSYQLETNVVRTPYGLPKPGLNRFALKGFLDQAKKDFETKWNTPTPSTCKLKDFERIQTLGTGSFGRVMLVQHKDTKKYFAMKILDKLKLGVTINLVFVCNGIQLG
ncbi:cAMP-dependent protein kinase catalytic subunit beta [Trichonephila clavipes]|nr:cAMP-dependent protein kinase catalytic subunit beta [Trichonephila clavipes]